MHSELFISILIPVYNWDVSPLLKELEKQANELSDQCTLEIIVVDDGSRDECGNGLLADKMSLVTYKRLGENRGRSVARNQLLKHANGNYVLFLDADMLPDGPLFLQNYIEQVKVGRDIVCGGISYKQIERHRDHYSFYLYKSSRSESIPAEKRNRSPWKYFFTSNILMRKEIADSLPFDSAFTGYGFEDIEWGIRLSKKYSIHHIDNTCTHMGVMTKEKTFEKMRQSIKNFALLLSLHAPETRHTAAGRISFVLQRIPNSLLTLFDNIFKYIFHRTSWNPLLFVIFQADKMILLAQERKRNSSLQKMADSL